MWVTPFGREVKRLRIEHDMTVRELGSRIGKSSGYVGQIETQGEIPTPEVVQKLSKAFGKEPKLLLNFARKSLLAQAERELNVRYSMENTQMKIKSAKFRRGKHMLRGRGWRLVSPGRGVAFVGTLVKVFGPTDERYALIRIKQ